jgi:hypothetical protein
MIFLELMLNLVLSVIGKKSMSKHPGQGERVTGSRKHV